MTVVIENIANKSRVIGLNISVCITLVIILYLNS